MLTRVAVSTLLAGIVTMLTTVPCLAVDAVSRAHTIYNLPDVPPGPVTEACSRAVTIYNLPDVPPPPATEALGRPLTVYNLPDNPPSPITEAVSRAITVLDDPLSGVPVESPPAVLALHPPRPNPFNPRTTLRFDLPERGRVRLSVYDVAGHLICTLVDQSLPRGSHEAVWDGRDSSGREVGSGSYLARLDFGGRAETVRLGLIR